MIVSTFNIQNDIRVYNKNKSKDIYNYIKKNKIDIIGLQEVFTKCADDLDILLTKYNIVGKYRYFFNIFHPYKNEKNPIITKYDIINYKTYHLPSYNSKYKRIITKACIKYNDKLVSIYNTHIEISDKSIQESQLNKIYELLKNDNNLIILMGDFNLKNSEKLYIDFCNKLKKLNIKSIDINSNTFKTSIEKEAIDHIFISDSFKVKKTCIIKDLEISDHYPVLIDII